MNETNKAAGIIVILDNTKRDFIDLPRQVLFLCLVDNNDRLDFPKGVLENEESYFECAIRETDEECNLSYNNFEKFHSELDQDAIKCGNNLFLFLGKVKKDHLIQIKPNPVTLEKEHKGYQWLTYKEAYLSLPDYLQEGLLKSKYLIKSFI